MNAHSLGYPLAAPRSGARAAAVWLLLIVIVGGVIAFSDGISKPFNNEWEYVQEEALTYEAPAAALVFAVFMLPLVFGFALQQRASLTEALLLWYVLCISTYTKDFAYLRIPGIPLFITDYLLLFLLIRVLVWPRLRVPNPLRMPAAGVVVLLLVGGLAAVRGLGRGESALLVARDYAMVAYSLFVVVAAALLRDWAAVKRVLLMVGVGCMLLSLNAWGWFLNAPGQRRYVLFPCILAGGFVGLLAATLNRVLPAASGWLATAAVGGGLVLANARSEYVAILATVGLMFLLHRGSIAARLKVLAAVVVIATVMTFAVLQTKAGSELVSRIVSDFVSGVMNPQDDPTAQFRFLAWGEAYSRFVQQPVLGEGYGIPFTFLIWTQDSRPHNTFLTFLYKSGVVGFLALLFFLGHFFITGVRWARRSPREHEGALLNVIVLSVFAVLLTGMFTLVFESPFVGAPLWLFIGVGYRCVRLLASAPPRQAR